MPSLTSLSQFRTIRDCVSVGTPNVTLVVFALLTEPFRMAARQPLCPPRAPTAPPLRAGWVAYVTGAPGRPPRRSAAAAVLARLLPPSKRLHHDRRPSFSFSVAAKAGNCAWKLQPALPRSARKILAGKSPPALRMDAVRLSVGPAGLHFYFFLRPNRHSPPDPPPRSTTTTLLRSISGDRPDRPPWARWAVKFTRPVRPDEAYTPALHWLWPPLYPPHTGTPTHTHSTLAHTHTQVAHPRPPPYGVDRRNCLPPRVQIRVFFCQWGHTACATCYGAPDVHAPCTAHRAAALGAARPAAPSGGPLQPARRPQ